MNPFLLVVLLRLAHPVQENPMPAFLPTTDEKTRGPIQANSTRVSLAEGAANAVKIEFLPAEWPNMTVVAETPWDWRKSGGLALEITNQGREAVRFGVRVDDDPSADGVVHCRSGSGVVEPGQKVAFVMTFGPDPTDLGMRGLPAPAGARPLGAGGSGPFEAGHIVKYQVFLHQPATPVELIVQNVHLAPPISLEGIVDAYGQYARAEWPGKLHHDAEFAARRGAEEADRKARAALPDRDRYGGWAGGPALAATGRFRTAKVGEKWAIVTPEGHLFFSLGLNEVASPHPTFVTGREAMFSWLPAQDDPLAKHRGYTRGIHSGPVKDGRTFDFFAANLERKFGPEADKAFLDEALARFPSWGFNTIANWSDARLYGNGRVPYVATAGVGGDHARVSSGSDYWGKMPDPFDPRFAEDAERSLRDVAARVKDDHWCIGYFVDNELSWAGGSEDGGRYGLAYGALNASAADSPAKRAFAAQLKSKYRDIARFNAAWGENLAGWQDLNAPFKPSGPSNEARKTDLSAFVKAFALQYFRVVRDALKRLDPDHLYMGCRFAWQAPEAVEAAAELCDVVSFNIYAPRLERDKWAHLTALNKPCIIGEFHFGALDRGMFHPGLVAAPSQQARADMYRDYVRSVLDHAAFVGCHWFEYIDEPLTGRVWDGENYNIGFVDVTDTPYPEMVAAARQVHAEAYPRRFGKIAGAPRPGASHDQDVQR